jgi:hypothetical protein
MSLTSTSRGGDFELAPAGTHIARCYSIVDLGTQTVEWKGQKKLQPKVHIRFELCNEMMEPDEHGNKRPFSVGLTVTNSTSPKANLRHLLESWAGRNMTEAEEQSFELQKLIGKACLVTVSHDKGKSDPSKVYANIKAITQLAKGLTAPEMVNPPFTYAVEQGRDDVFNSLSEYVQKKIEACEEWKAKHPADEEAERQAPETAAEPEDEDSNIPF